MVKGRIYGVILSLLLFNVQFLLSQNQEEKGSVNRLRNNISEVVRPEYVLHIKLKKRPNSNKVVITSMTYESRQPNIFKLLIAQKERIAALEKKEKKNRK
ncbi:hypothetical protein [Tenacibaculum jejuense]|uniref:Uncharacterized protein n=1 Tax=Tenacibaculum jejuense TaxID=584609 RepID=A0A238UDC4_9FLAO|nr:hypothetical protein [Tenacibaculum jejuense]SNR17026.1 protein of unknown function [Tenacibaculum jejuense]